MWRILKFLFTGDWHLHQWEKKETSRTFSSSYSGDGELPVKIYWILQCKECGNIKKKKV